LEHKTWNKLINTLQIKIQFRAKKSLFCDGLRGKEAQPRRKQLTELCLGENDGNMTPVCEPCKSLYFSPVCLTVVFGVGRKPNSRRILVSW
jgi:hypothetical protein